MKQYIVDAFTDKVFGGNPAAVCIMNEFPPDELMQNIALENNLSETAFAVKTGDIYKLRWFTPAVEVDFCGHATLGASYVIFNHYEVDSKVINFETKRGKFTVTKSGNLIEMDFPAYEYKKISVTAEMSDAVNAEVHEAYISRDLLMVVDDVKNITPDLEKLAKLDGLTQAVTAAGTGEFDCESRVFAPKVKVNEDPVTGSTHCLIAPYWADRLNKNKIVARQASERGGTLYCEVFGERVKIGGNAVLFAISELNI